MFPLSHTYVSTRVTGRKSPLLIFGSIIPDVVHLSKSGIDRKRFHDSPLKLTEFIQSNHPNLTDLALGVRLHSSFNHGADYYSDDLKEGFAKIEGRKILTEAASLWKVSDPETSLNLAHNFIEATVDLHIAEDLTDVIHDYQSSLDVVNLKDVSEMMAQYLNLDPVGIRKDLETFCNAFKSDNLINAKNLVEKVIIPWRERIFSIKADVLETSKVFKKAYELSKSYKDWLDLAVKQIKIDFKI